MAANDEISLWINDLKRGDERAARVIWENYFSKLVRLASKKLGAIPGRVADEEDVALSAMKSFVGGAAEGRFSKLDDREDLWKILVVITCRKVNDFRKRHFAQKRGKGMVRGESVFGYDPNTDVALGLAQVLGKEPSPELALQFAETVQERLALLNDESLVAVALGRLEGYSNEELAKQFGCAVRAIERKLQRIRRKWEESENSSAIDD